MSGQRSVCENSEIKFVSTSGPRTNVEDGDSETCGLGRGLEGCDIPAPDVSRESVSQGAGLGWHPLKHKQRLTAIPRGAAHVRITRRSLALWMPVPALFLGPTLRGGSWHFQRAPTWFSSLPGRDQCSGRFWHCSHEPLDSSFCTMRKSTWSDSKGYKPILTRRKNFLTEKKNPKKVFAISFEVLTLWVFKCVRLLISSQADTRVAEQGCHSSNTILWSNGHVL